MDLEENKNIAIRYKRIIKVMFKKRKDCSNWIIFYNRFLDTRLIYNWLNLKIRLLNYRRSYKKKKINRKKNYKKINLSWMYKVVI